MKRIQSLFTLSTFLLLLLLVIAGVAHGYNMFHFPYLENDEGTYMSQAWSLITQGKLAPYEYWYDHAPAGWMFIALWSLVSGGFFRFGLVVFSGRVFMLVLHLFSVYFLFDIGKKITKQPWAGFIAGLIFSLSPLAIYFQRRVLLDNIMIFWVLCSFWFLVAPKLTLHRVFVSALVFGIAVLTKENAIFFYPVLLYAVYKFSHPQVRVFSVNKWLGISLCVISLYILYAVYKGELLPPGFAGTSTGHVSLIQTMMEQLGRGKKLPFWDKGSDFMFNMSQWFGKDRYLMTAGVLASAIVSLLAIWFTYFRIPALLGIVFWIFLLRGGVVIDFYIIPLIPIMALNIGLLLDSVFAFVSNRIKVLYVLLSIATACVVIGIGVIQLKPVFTTDETTEQQNALTYIYTHVPKTAVIAVDAYGLVDLWSHGYSNAYWFWKLWTDPAVSLKLRSDWEGIEYVSLSHEMVRTMKSRLGVPDILREAYLHSKEITSFGPSKNTYIDLPNYVSTNGDWSTLYKVEPKYADMVGLGWKLYRQDFIKSGQVIDPKEQTTTSEGQSYALLRAVWVNDKVTFDEVWAWTKSHLQTRPHDHLLSWIYKNNTILDANSATDADLDTALALLFASKQWKSAQYANDAQAMLSDIWTYEVAHVGSHYVVVSSGDSKRATGYLVNPSYFSPAYFRIFGQADATHPWAKLADDVYVVLAQIQTSNVYGKNMVLPPNWVFIEDSGAISSAAPYNSSDVGGYGYDAFRTFYRVALDATWFNTNGAKQYLAGAAVFFQKEWNTKGRLAALYDVQGHPTGDYQDISTPVGAFSALVGVDIQTAHQIYQTYFENTFQSDGVWGGGRLYFDQNWAWFASALYKNALPNLYLTK